jgi:C1A family cysteine protease
LKQSWGREWGKRGHAYLPFEDLERLIAEDGDVCCFRELPTQKAVAA